jgi:hypothetical protein
MMLYTLSRQPCNNTTIDDLMMTAQFALNSVHPGTTHPVSSQHKSNSRVCLIDAA